jgi:YVTN family beta-propeller protein
VLTGIASTTPVLAAAPGLPLVDRNNLYSEIGSTHMSPTVRDDLERIYVPNLRSNDVYVIDPATLKVVDKFKVGVAEAHKRLDFRDPQSMKLQYSIDGRYALFTCEFEDSLVKIELIKRSTSGYLKLEMSKIRFKEDKTKPFDPSNTEICSRRKGMPQDIRISPDGKRFYVANMEADGVHVVDGDALKDIGFIPTGLAPHGLYPSRDAVTKIKVGAEPHGLTVWPQPGRYSLGHTGNLR